MKPTRFTEEQIIEILREQQLAPNHVASPASRMRTKPLCCGWSDPGSPGSRSRSFCTCQVLRPRRAVRTLAMTRPSRSPSAFATASAPGIRIFARLNGWPMHSPTDASFALADGRARLRVDADRYSFIVSDLRRLLLAGLSGALRKILDVTKIGLRAHAGKIYPPRSKDRQQSTIAEAPIAAG